MGERTALNYIQRMSGIATETNKYQKAIGKYPAKIADTRKTTPGFRAFEKYAVKMGGGSLHRFNLADAAMIKDKTITFCRDTNSEYDIFKVSSAFEKDFTPESLTELNLLRSEKTGSVWNLTIRNSREEIENALSAYSPMFTDIFPLSLEELFMYEAEQ